MKTNRVLGRGLSALIQGADDLGRLGDKEVRMVPLEAIGANPQQPRKLFNDNSLQELADSIGQVGVLQPILVRRLRTGEKLALQPPLASAEGATKGGASVEDGQATAQLRYCLVAGERRVRAARLAGIDGRVAAGHGHQDNRRLPTSAARRLCTPLQAGTPARTRPGARAFA